MINRCLFFTLFLSICGLTWSESLSFKTFTNPVISGDHSDCTLTKVGSDFYTAGSSFNPTPVVYHSTDLIHWEAIAQPVSAAWTDYGDATQGGCWGGQMVYFNGKYWYFFSRGGSMYFTTASKPQGPWTTTPTRMTNPSKLPYSLGYDNSVFIDDSKWYLIVKNGQSNNGIVELSTTGQPTGVVYNLSWLNSASKSYPYSWAEGPVMWKYKGFYYYSFARNVGGGQKVMRSKTLTTDSAAWTVPVNLFNESDPAASTAIFSAPNHTSAVVMINDSTHWLMHPVWARANNGEWYGQGRQGLVNQVKYDNVGNVVADYPINASKTAPVLPSSGIPWMVPKSDYFITTTLSPEWSFLGYTAASTFSLLERPGWLRLRPKSSTKANTVIKTDGEHNYSLMTKLDFTPIAITDEAGIRIINGSENLFAKLYLSVDSLGNKTICLSFDKIYYSIKNELGNIVWLKLVRENHLLTGYYSVDGDMWLKVGSSLNVSSLDSYSVDYNGWCGNRQGLYTQGKYADFDFYIYRDAYTPIWAFCPANQFGTSTSTLTDGAVLLDNIHKNDWALYAGVEFGDKDYGKTCDSVQILASSTISNPGAVEVWLDSIDTGKKIATVAIGFTSAAKTLKNFSAQTIETTGRHDVYLKFVGTSTSKLFYIKTLVFVPKKTNVSSTYSLQQDNLNCEFTVSPNPSSGSIEISSKFNFNRLELYGQDGILLFSRTEKNSIKTAQYDLFFPKGIYFVRISSSSSSSSSKLIIL